MSVDLSRCFPLSSICSEDEALQLTPDKLLHTCETLATHCVDNSSRRGSLYCGGLGPHVYVRVRLAHYYGSKEPTKSKKLRQQAYDAAMYALEQASDERGRVTLLESRRIGALSLVTVIEKLRQEGTPETKTTVLSPSSPPSWEITAKSIVDELSRKCQSLARDECEVLYGRAGAMAVVFFLRKELDLPDLGSEFLVQTAIDILQEGLKEAHHAVKHTAMVGRLPLLWQWHGKNYLGAAHGVVGILHTLLHLRMKEWDLVQAKLPHILDKVKETISSLASLEHSSGNLISSLSEQPPSTRTDRLVHWCHGATGHCLLLIKASQVFDDPQFLHAAEKIAESVIWPRGLLRKGVGLCHGISGNGYTLLCLARATKKRSMLESSRKWKARALQYANFATTHFRDLESTPDRPYSLYEGAAGLCTFLLDFAATCLDESSISSGGFPLYDFS